MFLIKKFAPSALMLGVVVATGCMTTQTEDSASQASVKFVPVKAPESDSEKRDILTSPYVVMANAEGKATIGKIGYDTLMRTGDKLESNTLADADTEVFGMLMNEYGLPVVDKEGNPELSNANEHTTLLDVHGKLFSVSQFESRPGAFYLMELNQDDETGDLDVIGMKHIDAADVRGGWVHCAASRTPWKSHLASEEYEPNARKRDPKTGEVDSYYESMHRFFSTDKTKGLMELNPYDYGWNIEVAVENAEGDTSVEKHYAMGRLSIELAYVMPDEKTVYITDDGTNVGLYAFIADQAGDLSAGTLYAMKWNQTSAAGVGMADTTWINLGHASNDEILHYLGGDSYDGNKLTFNDIFDAEDIRDNGTCAASYTAINTSAGAECLKVKPGMEKAASRLETRRFAAMMGATTELRKEEGITYSEENGQIYVAISSVERGMESFKKNGKDNTKYDLGGNNDIALDSYNKCGAVYSMDVNGNTKVNDTNGDMIPSEYMAMNMNGLIAGRPTTANGGTEPAYDKNGPYAANKCHLDGIANPDNITYMEGYNTLIIGEDTGSGHQNDVIWAYDIATSELTRIQTTPYGSETTSPYWYPFIDADGDGIGYGYLTSVIQHPYGESDEDKQLEADESRAYTGYVGPFPAM